MTAGKRFHAERFFQYSILFRWQNGGQRIAADGRKIGSQTVGHSSVVSIIGDTTFFFKTVLQICIKIPASVYVCRVFFTTVS